jgi:hypothetical protein
LKSTRFKTELEGWNWLQNVKHCYVKFFKGPLVAESPMGEVVLKDLAKFCRAHETTFHTDPHIAALMEGRREVWLRIQQYLQLTDKQLWLLRKNGE